MTTSTARSLSRCQAPYNSELKKGLPWKIEVEFSSQLGFKFGFGGSDFGDEGEAPLELAYALTIHKAQGKTLDKVGIDLTTGAFASGQVYVALSRSRTLTGIFLRSSIKPEDILIDDRVVSFNDSL